MFKLIVESLSEVNSHAKISGIALIPRISRNGNLYTKSEMRKADGLTVPLNWEHNSSRVIGEATFHYDESLEQLFYRGSITDESISRIVKNKQLFTSIEADVKEIRDVCNGPDDCFRMPIGLVWRGLALTDMPGVPETTVNLAEKFIGLAPHKCKRCCKVSSNTLNYTTKHTVNTGDSSLSVSLNESQLMTKENDCPEGQKWDADKEQCVPINDDDNPKESNCKCKEKTKEKKSTKENTKEELGPSDQAAGVDQQKPTEEPCGEGMKLVDGKCTPADNTDAGSPVSTGPKESQYNGPNKDEINKNFKEQKEMLDDLKSRINNLTQVDELKSMESFNQNLYKTTKLGATGSSLNTFAKDDLKYIAQEGVGSLKKFGHYSFDIDLSNDWVKENLNRNKVYEAISFTGDQSNKASVMDDVFVLPGGKYLKSIRDLVRFKEIPAGTDLIKFHKGTIPNQGTITEGSTNNASTHTITTVSLAADTVTGVAQTIKQSDIEDSPFSIFDYIAQTARAEVLEHEASLVFDSTADAATPALWIDGSDGDITLTDDNAATIGAIDHGAVARGLQHFEEQGYETEFGAIALALHPKALRELRTSSNLVRLVQEGDANITKTGRLTHLYGVELIPTTAIKAQDNATHDTYRNVMFAKGHTFILGSKRDLTIDMRKIPNESAFDWAWTQRKNAQVFDENALVRISSGQ